jgi:hypothetical protein
LSFEVQTICQKNIAGKVPGRWRKHGTKFEKAPFYPTSTPVRRHGNKLKLHRWLCAAKSSQNMQKKCKKVLGKRVNFGLKSTSCPTSILLLYR